MSPTASYRNENGVSWITFDDGKANAFNDASVAALQEALDQAEADDTYALAIEGRPGVFSGGLDLKLLPTLSPVELTEMFKRYAALMSRLFLFGKPTLAACTGHALAGGCVMLLTCDERVGVEGDFRIGLNETRLGVTMPSIVNSLVQQTLPPTQFGRALFQGGVFGPEEARQRGLLTETVASDRLAQRVTELGESARSVDLKAYEGTKVRLRKEAMDAAFAKLDDELYASFKDSKALNPER